MKKKPMMEEYFDTAQEFINKFGEKSILLWQCGSFYECYSLGEKGSEYNILEENKFQIESFRDICCMTVVAKGSQKCRNKQVFMAGFTTANPILLEKHINELMEEGFTVKVIVENGDDIVNKCKKRKELGTFSPGTTFNKSNKEYTNNIMCVWLEIHEKTMLTKEPYILCGSSIIDILTGHSDFIEFKKEGRHILKETSTVFDELENFYAINNPKEIIVIHNFKNEKNIGEIIQFCGFRPQKINIISIHDYHTKTHTEFEKQAYCFTKQNYQQEILSRFYKKAKQDYGMFLETTQLRNYPFSLQSFCFLLDYIYCHNPDLVHQIYEPKYDSNTEKLLLVSHALQQLNVIDTHVDTGPYSSVLKLLNKCITPMGKRLFNKKITNPTTNVLYLNKQYKITEHFIKNFDKFKYIREEFKNIRDTEKLYRKIVLQEAFPCELAIFYKNINSIHKLYQKLLKDNKIKKYLSINFNKEFENICLELTSEFEKLINIDTALNINNKKYDVNFINKGIFEDLDNKYDNYSKYTEKIDRIIKYIDQLLFNYQNTGKHFVKLHTTEKSPPYLELTSARASNLTKVLNQPNFHGYNPNISGIDFSSIKFGSATGGSKKIWGPEFKKLYSDFFVSKGVFHDQLKFSYKSILKKLERFDNHFKIISNFIESIDFILNNAFVAKTNNYCKPKIKKSDSAFFSVKELRHPLIEKINTDTLYIPNDIELGKNTKGILLFGTNAVGKSSLIKAIGISVILAQSGMFVPCSKFTFYPYKKLFTRIIGNDNIFKGLSTFQVEMSEFKVIDEVSDNNSLVLGDELCSGTEMGSAKSLFGSGLYRLDKRKSSYIFATHFHELGRFGIIEKCKYLKMKHMEVFHDNEKDKLIYNRKLQDGLGNNMYGLEVCKYLGFDKEFMELAYQIRKEEFPEYGSITKKKSSKYNNKLKVKCQFCSKPAVDMHHLLPQKDADENGFIGIGHKDHKANTIPLCKKCHHKETINNTKRVAIKTSQGIEYHTV